MLNAEGIYPVATAPFSREAHFRFLMLFPGSFFRASGWINDCAPPGAHFILCSYFAVAWRTGSYSRRCATTGCCFGPTHRHRSYWPPRNHRRPGRRAACRAFSPRTVASGVPAGWGLNTASMGRKPCSGAAVSGSAFAWHEPHRSRFHWPKSCRAHGAALFQQTAAIRQEIELVKARLVLRVFPGFSRFFSPRKRLEDCASPGAHFILCF
jgi:hypothetical protein